MGTNSVRQSGDLSLATSGNVWIAAGQKMRIEAQGTVVNPTGPAVPPVWGATQLENLVIAVNKGNTPTKTAFLTEIHNGDWSTSVIGTGNAGILTSTGAITLTGGLGKAELPTSKAGDIQLNSMTGSLVGTAKLDAKFKGIKSAEIGIGEEAASTDFLKFQTESNTLTTTKPLAITGTGAVTATITGDITNTFKGKLINEITGAVTNTYTGKYTNTITGAVNETVTGAVTQKYSSLNLTSEGIINITGTTVDIDGPAGINLN